MRSGAIDSRDAAVPENVRGHVEVIAGRAAGAVVVGLVALSGCSYFGREAAPYRPPVVEQAGPRTGSELYLRDCGWCHGSTGAGTARGPDLVSGTNGEAFTDFMLSTGRMPISSPDERADRAEPVYEPEEAEAIVAYVASLGGQGPAIPSIAPERGDLGVGEVLYQENCAACHSTTLVGGVLASERKVSGRALIAPGLLETTPLQTAEAMLVGPGAMPVFGPDTFSSEQINSIVRYVNHQQEPDDRGGAPIGHVGPVTEGAVGWIIGLGAMVIVCRWIGTKIGEE
jgi:ubiquinol-cytochrome c reductase cytochrome c subunit